MPHHHHHHHHHHPLVGHLYGNNIYEPPYNYNDTEQQIINLEKVATIRICLVNCEYGRLERRGLVFQLLDNKEIQVNYDNNSIAECEFSHLKHILAKL